ncbi:unnamed protein product [Dovyalis caffra]|uniref:Protein kinase domain-containing protein n=1 Tax=Dovyalis caffra TaxID=77055 RepID=A0AAV1R469_9ROSI|nr:unnamed protein product [Dovyalis caffra]
MKTFLDVLRFGYLRNLTFNELEKATSNFNEELGSGAFATNLDKIERDCEKEFKAEVNAIGRANHKNLVKLLGFCNKGEHRLLVYELIRNDNLANFLFGNSRLNRFKRMQIAFGVTRAKLLKTDKTRTSTAIRGTQGYIAPEWFKNLLVTVKTYRNISLGSSLAAESDNPFSTTPSEDFAFRFQQVGDAGFLIAIWFNKIPERIIVWSADRNKLVQRGSRVRHTTNGLVRQACLSDCYCDVAIFRDRNCWMKRMPLSNGRIDLNVDGKAMIKVTIGSSTTGPNSKKNDRSTSMITGSALIGSSPCNVRPDVNLVSFNYNELETATRGLKEEPGSGAFVRNGLQRGSSQ